MNQRIRKIRKELDITQKEFAERIGVSRANIGKYETGISEPSAAVLSLICREFNVQEEWLRTGEGEMFRAAPSDELDTLAHKYNLSNTDYVIVEKFLKLRPESRKAIFDFIHEVDAAFSDGESNPHAPVYSGNEKPFPMDGIIEKIHKSNAEPTTEELEELYKKSRLNSAQNKEPSASSTTGRNEKEETNVSNQ